MQAVFTCCTSTDEKTITSCRESKVTFQKARRTKYDYIGMDTDTLYLYRLSLTELWLL